MPLELILSQKKKPLLILDNYVFNIHRETEGKIVWRCEEYKKKCLVRCHTTSKNAKGKILLVTSHEHNHMPNTARIEARQIVNNIRKKARATKQQTASIVAEAVATASDGAASILPNMNRLARIVQRHRPRSNPRTPTRKSLEELVLQPINCQTMKGVNFLIKDSGGPDRYLIFGTEENLDFLETCTDWFVGRKFLTANFLFQQLYTIHCKCQGDFVPLVYIFLPSECKEIYREVLLVLKQLRPGIEPQSVMVDFEKAVILAWQEVFPNVRVKGCYFHFCQAISKRIHESKLKSLHRNDPKLTHEIRKVCALVFVPPKQVFSSFQKLKKSKYYTENMDTLSELLEYMERTWIGTPKRRNTGQEDPLFAIEMWNHYSSVINDQPRTNNSIKGFYNRLSSRLLKDKSTFYSFLELIISEQGVIEFRIAQAMAGRHKPNKRRIKYDDYDQRLKTIVESYEERNTLTYLSRVADVITVFN